MIKKDLLKFIPFGIASILVLTHVIQTLLTPGYVNEYGLLVTYSIVDSVIYASLGLVIVLTLILMNKPVWKYLFTILTIFAFTPWISFYHQTFSFGIGFISFEITALLLLIFHLILNPEIFIFFKSFLETKPESEESKQANFESSVNGFETRFRKKSKDELEKIVKRDSLMPEAIEAAKRLLERR